MSYCLECASVLAEQVIDGRLRQRCPACGWTLWEDPKLAVAVVITDGESVLLGRRAQGMRTGQWSMPAGFVDRGERVESAAEREVFEETGLITRVSRLVTVVSEADNPVVLLVFEAEVERVELKATEEMSELRWFGPSALPELAFDHDADILRKWLLSRR